MSRPARILTKAEIEVVETVRDAEVAVTLCSVANELEADADAAECLLGGDALAARIRARGKKLRALLGQKAGG